MFVEITRLLIVFLATASGFALGRDMAGAAGNGAVLGAALGACSGYVTGGILGRLLRQAMGVAERRIEATPPARLLAGTLGAAAAGGLCLLIGFPITVLTPTIVGWPILALLVWIGVYSGWTIAGRKSAELFAVAGLSTRPLVRAAPYGHYEPSATLVDSSAIIDGRLLPLARSGFLRGSLLVPRVVLEEVQAIADAQDPVRRRRGRRGLDLLEALQRTADIDVNVIEDDAVELEEVDAKLVALARRLGVGLLTVDQPLQRVAELQGVRCLNIEGLAEGVRSVHIAGERVLLPITRAGKEPGQGVGYLDDGTMVVVGDASTLVGQEVEVRITGNVQTSVGKMLFAAVAQD